MKYLIDTDHASWIQTRKDPEFSTISDFLAVVDESDIAYSIVTVYENVHGAYKYLNNGRTPADAVRGYEVLSRIIDFYRSVPVVPFNDRAAAEFARLKVAGVKVDKLDLQISSIALSRGLVVVTRNIKDYGRVPALSIEDWTKKREND